MGSRLNGQGQSRYTIEKESAFGMCLGWHMCQETRVLKGTRHPYFHVDLNAGCGYNHTVGVVGTPELFLRQLRKYPLLPVRVWFVESDHERAQALSQRLKQRGCYQGSLFDSARHFEMCVERNAVVLDRLVDEVARYDRPQYARGSIISDPNGWSPATGALDLTQAARVLAQLPHFLLLVSFGWGRAKAVRAYVMRGEHGAIKGAVTRRTADYLPLRPHWLISEPAGQYVYLCGSAHPFPPARRLVSLRSTRGQEILRRCDEITST